VIRAEYGNAVKGWEQIREELSLQDGECELEGVTIINQAENFHDGEEHLGTFAEFANNRRSLTLDLPKTTPISGHITAAIGRERFWSVLRGDNE